MINNVEKSNVKYPQNPSTPQTKVSEHIGDIAMDEGYTNELVRNAKLNNTSIHEFYNFPKYYDKAFTRDIKSDILFFKRCFQQYSDVEVKRVLEPACGPGMFLEVLPDFGYRALGYDLSPAMVRFAKEKLRKSGLNINQADVIEGNMKDMRFDELFDAGFICINSLGYLRSDADIISHFKVMAKSLKAGGIYIVEISCKCDDIRNEKKFDDTWYVREDNFDLELTWAINWYDVEQKIRHVDFHMVVNDNGYNYEVKEAHELRLWIFNEFKQLSKSGGFEIVGIFNQNYEKIAENIPITGELGALFFILKKIC